MSVRKSRLISFTFDNIYIYVCVCVCVKLKINPKIRKCTNKETGCPEDSSDCCIHVYCKNLKLAALFSDLLQVSFVYMSIEMMRINNRHLKNVGGYSGRNIVFCLLTITMRTTVWKITTKAKRTLFLLISTYIASVALCGWAAKADDYFVSFGAKPDKGFLDMKSRRIRKL